MTELFMVVTRPARRRRRAAQPREAVLAVTATIDTGQAIAFPDASRAHLASVSAARYFLLQGRRDVLVRRTGATVWVERRVEDAKEQI